MKRAPIILSIFGLTASAYRQTEAFVEEGGLQQFIDFVNEFADDDFLNAPFGEIYG